MRASGVIARRCSRSEAYPVELDIDIIYDLYWSKGQGKSEKIPYNLSKLSDQICCALIDF